MRTLTRLSAAALLALPPALAAQGAIPSPQSILGFEPGADRHLPSWKQITDYFTAVSKASPRVRVRTLGKTTLGRPFLAVFISDSATLANLEHYRQIQRQLMDPRQRNGVDVEKLIPQAKNVILITSAIHSTESGGFSSPLVFTDRLARGESPEAKLILANTILILVPSQNPDGVDIVGDWYRATLGTSAEGTSPPQLYHYYVGHDDNRDWYSFTQVETRYTVDSLYTPWDPEIVNDIHQQGANSGRIFIPPYMDPVEPNIDPILTASTNALGQDIVFRMISDGFTGIASNAAYDMWSPARQYSLYHRGARLLTETASARLASPMDMPFDRLGPARGYDARVATWNYPVLWPGGTWTYGDIVRYQTEASWALFVSAARDREAWIRSYVALADRAVGNLPAWGNDAWPSADVIPKAQRDTQALRRLLWTLQHGQVEIHESATGDSYVIPMKQPYGGYAKALLERQKYPDLHDYPGGPPTRPYDVTAHTLPLLFGVDVTAVTGPEPAMGRVIPMVPDGAYTSPLTGKSPKRIAIYRSFNESMDEGWTRWVFDNYRIPFTSITDKDVHAGSLNSRFDVIILPDQQPRAMANGLGNQYPDSLRGGLGDAGAAALESFVTNGGTLLAFNDASRYAIDNLKLPVKDVLAGVRNTDFYCPGSILSVEYAHDSPITRGLTASVPEIWFENGPAFEITDPTQATAVATYSASGNQLLSGWLLGGSRLNGKAALVDVKHGKGHAVLYGFMPTYRGQAVATYPLIWGAILE